MCNISLYIYLYISIYLLTIRWHPVENVHQCSRTVEYNEIKLFQFEPSCQVWGLGLGFHTFNDIRSTRLWCAFCSTFHSDSEILFLDVYYTLLVHVVLCFCVCAAAARGFSALSWQKAWLASLKPSGEIILEKEKNIYIHLVMFLVELEQHGAFRLP